jgi:hypothetical protein
MATFYAMSKNVQFWGYVRIGWINHGFHENIPILNEIFSAEKSLFE